MNEHSDATRAELPATSCHSALEGCPGLVGNGDFLSIVLFVCGLGWKFYVVLFVFWPFSFPYSFSQHMVLIMCWKSRQAAGQTAMSPSESSKSSTTSKVSATLQSCPPDSTQCVVACCWGLPQIPFVFWQLIIPLTWKGNLFLA